LDGLPAEGFGFGEDSGGVVLVRLMVGLLE
jgi:hypothetical protein